MPSLKDRVLRVPWLFDTEDTPPPGKPLKHSKRKRQRRRKYAHDDSIQTVSGQDNEDNRSETSNVETVIAAFDSAVSALRGDASSSEDPVSKHFTDAFAGLAEGHGPRAERVQAAQAQKEGEFQQSFMVTQAEVEKVASLASAGGGADFDPSNLSEDQLKELEGLYTSIKNNVTPAIVVDTPEFSPHFEFKELCLALRNMKLKGFVGEIRMLFDLYESAEPNHDKRTEKVLSLFEKARLCKDLKSQLSHFNDLVMKALMNDRDFDDHFEDEVAPLCDLCVWLMKPDAG